MKMRLKKTWSLILSVALVFSSFVGAVWTEKASQAASLKLNKKTLNVNVRGKATLKVKNAPKKAKVTWSSKNKKIATVSKKGVVKGVKAGSTKIVAKVTYKSKKKKVTKKLTAKVTVKAIKATSAPSGTPAAVPTNTPAPTPKVNITPEPVTAKTPSGEAKAANIKIDGTVEDSNLGDEHTSRYGQKTKDNGLMRTNLSTKDITPVMGRGWNIGNSLEQVGAGSCENLTEEEQKALTEKDWVKGFETNAGNALATQKLFTGLKQYGINTVRIPIAWSNLLIKEKQADGSTYYRIREGYFDRVEEIINYCLNEEMYVIINDHWDNQWWGMFGDKDEAVRKEAWKRYEDLWTQIAERYAEYSDRLIFEGANEELGERLNDDWTLSGSKKTGVLTEEETFALTNQINQKFVDIVRGSGVNADGTKNNNYYRFLLIPGYDTNLHQTCGDQYSDKAKKSNDKLTYTMPKDVEENTANKLFVSIHYYDPLGWGIAKTTSDGPYDTPKGKSAYVDTWGSDADYAAMLEDFEAIKTAFVDKGYNVIFGEFGVVSVNKDGIPAYFKEFFEKSKEYGAVPVMWDAGEYVSRKGTGNKATAYFVYEDIGKVFCEVAGIDVPELKYDAQKELTNTGKPENLVLQNQNPLIVATWEGNFMRNTTSSSSVDIEGIRAMFGPDFITTVNNSTVGAYFKTDQTIINPSYSGLSLAATSDKGFWHMHLKLSDWSVLKEPALRITMHDDEISKSSQLQLVYSDGLWDDGKDYAWRYEADYEQVVKVDGKDKDGKDFKVPAKDENGNLVLADTAWQEKVLKLKPEYLTNYPVILITTNDFLGVDFVKVEICDAAYHADGALYSK